jgi:hypothetical protein
MRIAWPDAARLSGRRFMRMTRTGCAPTATRFLPRLMTPAQQGSSTGAPATRFPSGDYRALYYATGDVITIERADRAP